jgi:hypothetical protein
MSGSKLPHQSTYPSLARRNGYLNVLQLRHALKEFAKRSVWVQIECRDTASARDKLGDCTHGRGCFTGPALDLREGDYGHVLVPRLVKNPETPIPRYRVTTIAGNRVFGQVAPGLAAPARFGTRSGIDATNEHLSPKIAKPGKQESRKAWNPENRKDRN